MFYINPALMELQRPPAVRQAGDVFPTSFAPVRLRIPGEAWFQFPIDPQVSISGKNTLITRSVLKPPTNNVLRRGTVKELFQQGDYVVRIAGLISSSDHNMMPERDLRAIRAILEHRGVVEVAAECLVPFNITRLAVQSYEFPFTAGVHNARFSISALSDDIDMEDLLL